MLYNLAFCSGLFQYARWLLELEQSVLNRFLNAYEQGEADVFIRGKTWSLSDISEVYIYDCSKVVSELDRLNLRNEASSIDIKSSFATKELEAIFHKYGNSQTDNFIQGKWGYRRGYNTQKLRLQPNKPILEKTAFRELINIEKPKKGRFFISHSNHDKAIVDKFIENIFQLGLMINPDKIFYTSVHGMDVKSGQDFKQKIKSELENATAVFQFLSPNYKESEICLNEMGAAWVLNTKVIPLLLPGMNYDIGFIHNTTQQLRIDDKQSLLKFYDDHKGDLWVTNINLSNYHRQVDSFLEFTKDHKKHQSLPKKQKTDFYYEEVVELKGILIESKFQHPPGTKSGADRGWERYHYIKLNTPINVLSKALNKEKNSFDVDAFEIDEIHIAPQAKIQIPKNLQRLINNRVRIKGNFMGAHTAWHQTPVMFLYNLLESSKD